MTSAGELDELWSKARTTYAGKEMTPLLDRVQQLIVVSRGGAMDLLVHQDKPSVRYAQIGERGSQR